ncbi:PucR family transcriptional regulator ligand-binding domain-containing protein [Amycolatopsis acidiphila]|nr:PucR family transcriptional regulator [Amycolatopsis acidiphila]UIJ63842.1 PucR family transcriptional regulator ligand-binding domain-containing protein [Amycolatopsis acidiphila]
MLRVPSLHLTLVTGSSRLRERRSVRWVHISELPDPSPWLQGGELLLTTGCVIGQSERMQREFVRRLDETGCVGIGFSMGTGGEPLPGMVDEAKIRNFPLFTIPHEVPLMAITSWVSDYLNQERNQVLTRAMQMHRAVLRSVLHGGGLAGVVKSSAAYLPEFSFLLFDYYGRLVAEHWGGTALPDPAQAFSAISKPLRDQERVSTEVEGAEVTAAVVRVPHEVEAVLLVAGTRGMQEHELLLFEQALTGIGIELTRLRSFRLERRRQVGELLDDVVTAIFDDSVIRLRLARLEIDPGQPYQVLCVHRPEEVSEHALAALIEDSLGTATPMLVGTHDGELYCVVQSESPEPSAAIAKAAEVKGWHGVRVGRSLPRSEVGELLPAMREARLCASAPLTPDVQVRDVTVVGVPGLVAGLHAHPAIGSFVRQVIGPLCEQDRRDGSRLLETVRAYLRHGCRPGAAASDLHIHRHTLSYRLERVHKLTGCDLREGNHFLTFGLALEAYDQGLAQPGQVS